MLEEFIAFRGRCRKIYEKHHPNNTAKVRYIEIPSIEIVEEVEVQNLEASKIEFNPSPTIQINTDPLDEGNKQNIKKAEKKKPKTMIVKEMTQEEQEGFHDSTSSVMNENEQFYVMETDINTEEPSKTKGSRKCWTAAQKLDVVDFAERTSNRHAARHFKINESTIRNFRKNKEMLKAMQPTRSTNRHGSIYWPDLEVGLKEWIQSLPETPKIHEIQKKAIELAKNIGCEKFSGSISYIYKFMQRNGINSSSPRPRKTISFTVNDALNE